MTHATKCSASNATTCAASMATGTTAVVTAPWCGACKHTKELIGEAEKNGSPLRNYLSYDIDEEGSVPEPLKKKIEALPAVVKCPAGATDLDACEISYGVKAVKDAVMN